VRQEALAFSIGSLQLRDPLVQLLRSIDHLRLQGEVPHEQLVLQTPDLFEHRALASALVGFARETGTELIAEGVETTEEALILRSLGVPLIQGYFAARPGSIPDRLVIPLPSAFHG
jgi:hypothetical protein